MVVTMRLTTAIVATAILTTACASTATGPSVMVLPGTGKTFDQFQAEDARCRQAAATDAATAKEGTVHPQQRYDMAYMQCMYAAGNQIPMAGRPPGPGAANLPQPPAGTPPGPPPATSR